MSTDRWDLLRVTPDTERLLRVRLHQQYCQGILFVHAKKYDTVLPRMVLDKQEKESLRQALIASLCPEREVRKIVIFGSFLHFDDPNDLDVAVFQDSSEAYLPLAMKYRRKTRAIAKKIPLDIIPLKTGVLGSSFLAEIDRGEVIYER